MAKRKRRTEAQPVELDLGDAEVVGDAEDVPAGSDDTDATVQTAAAEASVTPADEVSCDPTEEVVVEKHCRKKPKEKPAAPAKATRKRSPRKRATSASSDQSTTPQFWFITRNR